MDKLQSSKPPPLFPSCRLGLALMILTGTFNLFFMRINLSFALVCMVQPAKPGDGIGSTGLCNGGSTNESAGALNVHELDALPNSTGFPTFDWSKEIQGHILGAYFWGYMVTQLIGGFISDRSSGGKMLSIFGMAVYSGLTILIPVAANIGVEVLIVVRFLQGVFSGLSLPSFHVLCSRWIRAEERGRLMGLGFSGFSFAACITYPLSSLLCQYGFAGGWPSVFYVTGWNDFSIFQFMPRANPTNHDAEMRSYYAYHALEHGITGVIWCIASCWLIYDTPLTHPRISSEELEYLRHLTPERKNTKSGKRQKVPWVRLFTAPPVLAYIVVHFCNNWGFYVLIINLPLFMKEVYNFSTTNNGVLSAVPYIAALVTRFSIGPIFDTLLKRRVATMTRLRKLFNTVGMVVPAAAMLFIGLLTCDERYAAVALLAVCSGVNELAFSAGYLYSAVELAPQYVGILTGVSNTFGTAPGFITPAVVAALTPNRTRQEWLTVFYLTSAIQLCGALVYAAFGSSEKLDLSKSEDLETPKAEVEGLVQP